MYFTDQGVGSLYDGAGLSLNRYDLLLRWAEKQTSVVCHNHKIYINTIDFWSACNRKQISTNVTFKLIQFWRFIVILYKKINELCDFFQYNILVWGTSFVALLNMVIISYRCLMISVDNKWPFICSVLVFNCQTLVPC